MVDTWEFYQFMFVLCFKIESFLRTEVDLVEDDIRLVLNKFNSSFITHELEPGIFTFKDLSEALYNIIQSEYPGPSNVIDVEFDEITMKTKLVYQVIESVDTMVITGATSTSITLSITGVGLNILPIYGGIACTLSLGNKVLHKLIIHKYNKYRKQYEKDQQTNKSFDKLY